MSRIQLTDTFAIDGVRRTEDGYLTAFAKVARTGIQQYRGWELGRPNMDVVRVYRPPEEVFAPDAMHSAAHKPLTLRHPPRPVTAKNWKQYSGGQTGSEVVRDGEFIRVPMVMMDAAMIDAYERHGVDQLSLGYGTDIKWESGVVPQGTTDAGMMYDAVQTNIRINHLALVPVARGGDQLRVGDDDVDDAWSDKARAAAAAARAAHKNGDAHGVAKAFRDHLRAEGMHATISHHNDDIDKAGDSKEIMLKYREEHAAKADKIAKSHPGIDHMNTYHEGGQSFFYTHEYKDKKHQKDGMLLDGTCPECGAEMQGKTCPECNYVKDEQGELNMKTIMLDGLTVTVGDDQSASIVQRVVDGFTKKLSDAAEDLENLKKGKKKSDEDLKDALDKVSAKDGEIVVLKKQIADSAMTPAKLDELVKDRLSVIDRAVVILGKDFAFDGKTLDDIRKAAVELKLGDAAKGMDAAAIGGAFAALCADAAAARGGTQPIADSFAARRPGGLQQRVSASDAAYEESRKALENAWKTPASAA